MTVRVALLIAILTASCGKKNDIPGGIMDQKKMREVLWDMMRADQFLTDYVMNIDSTASRSKKSYALYSQVLALHEINQETFRESFYYYRSHPELMKVIMDSISKKQLFEVDTSLPKLAIDTLPAAGGVEDSLKRRVP